ncbi:MAG: phosphonate ABC transporter, permease protein PhnE [Planctomycetes bacterium]|nr:phosphonate ABC transporter, permease protein PhnE [Planctomycetota bacterium]
MSGPHVELVVAYLRRDRRRRIATVAIATVALSIVVACVYAVLPHVPRSWAIDVRRLLRGPTLLVDMLAKGLPPDFSRMAGSEAGELVFVQQRPWLWSVVETLAMSIAGTAVGVVLALPLGLLAARSTSPHPAIYVAARGLLGGLRTVHELILAIVFVAAFGFGPWPAVLALSCHSLGMLGKFYAEAIERAPQGVVVAAKGAGFGVFQRVVHVVIPGAMPAMTDATIYRWECNLRSATVMSLAGAGGLGQELVHALKLFNYREAVALLIVLFALVLLGDLFGAWLRRRLA